MYDTEKTKSWLPPPGRSSAHRELTFRLGQQCGVTNPNTLFTKARPLLRTVPVDMKERPEPPHGHATDTRNWKDELCQANTKRTLGSSSSLSEQRPGITILQKLLETLTQT